jgi:hypothetical protein
MERNMKYDLISTFINVQNILLIEVKPDHDVY